MSEVLPMPFPCPVCQTPVAGTPADTTGSRDTTTSSTPTPSCGCPDCNKLMDLFRAKFPHQHISVLKKLRLQLPARKISDAIHWTPPSY